MAEEEEEQGEESAAAQEASPSPPPPNKNKTATATASDDDRSPSPPPPQVAATPSSSSSTSGKRPPRISSKLMDMAGYSKDEKPARSTSGDRSKRQRTRDGSRSVKYCGKFVLLLIIHSEIKFISVKSPDNVSIVTLSGNGKSVTTYGKYCI